MESSEKDSCANAPRQMHPKTPREGHTLVWSWKTHMDGLVGGREYITVHEIPEDMLKCICPCVSLYRNVFLNCFNSSLDPSPAPDRPLPSPPQPHSLCQLVCRASCPIQNHNRMTWARICYNAHQILSIPVILLYALHAVLC